MKIIIKMHKQASTPSPQEELISISRIFHCRNEMYVLQYRFLLESYSDEKNRSTGGDRYRYTVSSNALWMRIKQQICRKTKRKKTKRESNYTYLYIKVYIQSRYSYKAYNFSEMGVSKRYSFKYSEFNSIGWFT